LREAIPFYEGQGGIEIRLLEDLKDDHRFVELVLYEDEAAYRRDQERVETDPEMRRFLERWRSLLAEPPTVEVYRLTRP
jgi:quinol monooxygenase YgiN